MGGGGADCCMGGGAAAGSRAALAAVRGDAPRRWAGLVHRKASARSPIGSHASGLAEPDRDLAYEPVARGAEHLASMMHDVTVHAVAGPPVRHGQRPIATGGWHCTRSTPSAGRSPADITVIVIPAMGRQKPNTCSGVVRVLEENPTHPTPIMPSIRRSKIPDQCTGHCRVTSTAAIRPAETVMPRKTGAPSRCALRDAAKLTPFAKPAV